MKFPLDVAAWLQRNLVTMSIDDISAMGLSEANLNQTASGTADQWQFTVDMIYRCLVCGLISAGPTEKWLRSIHQPDVAGFARTLADINPFDFSDDPGHWFETFFVDTEFCRLRVAHYGLLDADVAEKIARKSRSRTPMKLALPDRSTGVRPIAHACQSAACSLHDVPAPSNP